VSYTTGHQRFPEGVPAAIKQAIVEQAAYMYINRADSGKAGVCGFAIDKVVHLGKVPLFT